MSNQELMQDLTHRMESAIKVLNKEFLGLRTGRASVNLLDPVVVDSYGSPTPIAQVSTVSTPDARTLSVQVWDRNLVKSVEKAIADANLGLNPCAEGQLIRIPIPPINEERRKELAKVAAKYAENTKISVRNVRRDGMDQLKNMEKDHKISKDEHHNYGLDVQKITDDFVKQIDVMLHSKEKEILTV